MNGMKERERKFISEADLKRMMMIMMDRGRRRKKKRLINALEGVLNG